MTGFDVLVLPVDKITAVNTLSVPDQAATRGLMAVSLHSLSTFCVPAGARVSVSPPLAATVIYSRPGSGALDEPDLGLTAVQPGARIDFWLAGVVPPGNMRRRAINRVPSRVNRRGERRAVFGIAQGRRSIADQSRSVSRLETIFWGGDKMNVQRGGVGVAIFGRCGERAVALEARILLPRTNLLPGSWSTCWWRPVRSQRRTTSRRGRNVPRTFRTTRRWAR